MGEIGIDRNLFLYELQSWEIKKIIAGYRRRQENDWSMHRWQTWWLLHNGMNDMKNFPAPTDLLPLPHDGASSEDQPTSEEIQAMQEEMRRHNENLNNSNN